MLSEPTFGSCVETEIYYVFKKGQETILVDKLCTVCRRGSSNSFFVVVFFVISNHSCPTARKAAYQMLGVGSFWSNFFSRHEPAKERKKQSLIDAVVQNVKPHFYFCSLSWKPPVPVTIRRPCRCLVENGRKKLKSDKSSDSQHRLFLNPPFYFYPHRIWSGSHVQFWAAAAWCVETRDQRDPQHVIVSLGGEIQWSVSPQTQNLKLNCT